MQDEVPIGPHHMRWTVSGPDGAPPVVLVHSSGMSSRQWRRLEAALATRYRVFVPDLIGYGRSSAWPRGERAHFVLDQLALERLLDRIGAPVHLVGHSYGGFLSLLVTLHRPRAIRSLAVYEPVSFGVLRSTRDPALASVLPGDADAAWPDTDAELEAWLEGFVDYWNGPGGWRSMSDAFRAGMREVARKVVGEVRTLGEERTPHVAYATIEAPALLLGGEGSTLAAKRVLRVLESAMPRATRHEIAEAGHMGPLTHAHVVGPLVAAHLDAASASEREP